MGGNYLNSILATQECKKNGFDEALLLDQNGNISEAPGENIFLIRKNCIITPSLNSSALEGITRDTIISLGKDFGYEVQEREVTRGELLLAEEIFLSGTAAEITPIISVDHEKIGNGKVGKITRKLMKSYTDLVMNRNENYSGWLTPVY